MCFFDAIAWDPCAVRVLASPVGQLRDVSALPVLTIAPAMVSTSYVLATVDSRHVAERQACLEVPAVAVERRQFAVESCDDQILSEECYPKQRRCLQGRHSRDWMPVVCERREMSAYFALCQVLVSRMG